MPQASRKASSRRPSAPRPRFTKRYQRVEDLPIVHRHAAGIDLAGAASHFVAVEVGDEIEVREFGGTTDEVRALVSYLGAQGVTTVAMEATGVYWMVVYDLLEAAGLEVFLVNPTHVKHVPGRRKDDKLDCRWLQKLHKYGLLSASFRPHPEDRPLQSLYRQRTRLVRLAADELRRMQQALDVMNVRVHKALSDLGGQTGMRILRAIVAGERDPAVLATHRDPRCACTPEELQAALTGHYLPHQVLALQQALARYDLLTAQLGALDTAIEATLGELLPLADADVATQVAAPATAAPGGKHAPTFPVMRYLILLTGQDATQIPGIAAQSALGLQAELGRDLTKWPTAKHFTSYLTLAPVPKISGGKLLSSRTHPGSPPAAVIFKQAAAAVTRTDTAFGASYRQLAVRIGSGKALTALARKIAEQYYYLMRYGQAYLDVGAEQYAARARHRQIAALTKRAKKLGLTVLAPT
ncbi:MAG: IS110 family RNA-guided transposase [Armatimonadota bacterium]